MPVYPTASPTSAELCVGVYNAFPNTTTWSFQMTFGATFAFSDYLAYQQGANLCIPGYNPVGTGGYYDVYVTATPSPAHMFSSQTFYGSIYGPNNCFVVSETAPLSGKSKLTLIALPNEVNPSEFVTVQNFGPSEMTVKYTDFIVPANDYSSNYAFANGHNTVYSGVTYHSVAVNISTCVQGTETCSIYFQNVR